MAPSAKTSTTASTSSRSTSPRCRNRTEDIPLLATHFSQKYSRPGKGVPQITTEALDLLLDYSWPGNIRQLENAIERASITARDGWIEPRHLPTEVRRRSGKKSMLTIDLSRPLPEQLAALTSTFEERYLRKALKRTRGHVGRCAKLSGLSRRSVSAKISQYGIDTSSYQRRRLPGQHP